MGHAEEPMQRRLAPPSVETERLRIQSGASEMGVKDKEGGNHPAAKCIRCERVLLATDPHSFQVWARPGDFMSIWDTQASASLLKIALSSADVINDSCSLDASVHSPPPPPLSWHCPATTTPHPPTPFIYLFLESGPREDGVVPRIRYFFENTHITSAVQHFYWRCYVPGCCDVQQNAGERKYLLNAMLVGKYFIAKNKG